MSEADHERMQKRMKDFLADIDPEIRIVLGGLARRIYEWNDHQGFWASENTGEKLMLMVTELAEAMEQHRKPHPDQHLPDIDGLTVELADCIIRILDFSGRHSLPLAEAFSAKLVYNLSRPYKHGKAC